MCNSPADWHINRKKKRAWKFGSNRYVRRRRWYLSRQLSANRSCDNPIRTCSSGTESILQWYIAWSDHSQAPVLDVFVAFRDQYSSIAETICQICRFLVRQQPHSKAFVHFLNPVKTMHFQPPNCREVCPTPFAALVATQLLRLAVCVAVFV